MLNQLKALLKCLKCQGVQSEISLRLHLLSYMCDERFYGRIYMVPMELN